MTNINPFDMTQSSGDPQILLSEALAKRNIQEFRAALKAGAKPLITDDRHFSVFEKALQTPGCAEFVEECLKTGCDPNYVNTHYNKALVNYATDSCDPAILKSLLANPGINVDFKYSELPPLIHLVKKLKQENSHDIFQCLNILLDYGASPNITDQRGMTPLHYISNNNEINAEKKYEFLQLFVKRPDLDAGLKTLFEKKFVDDEFKNATEEENLQLLFEAIEKGTHMAFDFIMSSSVNYNQPFRNNNTAIEIAWINGNCYALKKLLEQKDIKIRRIDNPLSCIVKKLHENPSQTFCDYWKCFYILLESDKIDINKRDKTRSTALHYAVKYRNTRAIKELLKRGADICLKNSHNVLAIAEINPKILEEHLNDCVTSNEANFWDENFEIVVSFKNFIPVQKLSLYWKEVMTPMDFMAENKDYRYLLQHPVITSFLFFQWYKLFLPFYANFLVFLIYALSVITHAVLTFKAKDFERELLISGLLAWLGILYLAIRESAQFIVCPIRYLCSFANYVEALLILLSVMTCSSTFTFDDETRRNIAVCTILLAAVEICLLVGSLPISSISTHMLMLKAVCKSFLKSFMLYSIFIISFTLCFFIKNDSKLSKDNENYFHSFPNPLVAFVKTIAMLTGEFDAGSLTLDSDFSYCLFLLFVFFMTIILFNLLNGLAVSNTQAIQDQEEYNYIICRTRLLARTEQLVVEPYRYAKSLVNRQPFVAILKFIVNLCPHLSTSSEIAILPNDNNRVVLPKLKLQKGKECGRKSFPNNETMVSLMDEDSEEQQHHQQNVLPCCLSFIIGKCSTMDKRTVKLAMAILERKSMENSANHSESIEEKLEIILKHIAKQEI